MEAEELFKKHVDFAYWIANKYVKSYTPEREDIYQEALKGLWKAVLSFDSSKKIKFMSYAGRVITNEVLMYLRKLKKSALNISIYTPLNEQQCLLDTIKDDMCCVLEIEEKMDLDIVRDILNNYDLQDRAIEAFKLLLQGKTQKEVAKKMKITQPAVAGMKDRAMRKIQKIYLNTNRGETLMCKTIKN